MNKNIFFAFVAALLPALALATERIETDGPDFVESAEVVGKGRFQFEASIGYTRDNRDGTRIRETTTPVLLRYGVTDNVEIRLETEGATRISSDEGRIKGMSDSAIGLKWHSHDKDAEAGKPAVSWILHFEAPSGSRNLRGPGTRPSLRSVIAWDLPNDFSAGLMPGVKYDSQDDGRRYWSGILGATVAKQFTENFRIFVEYGGEQLAHARDGGIVSTRNIGWAYTIGKDWLVGGRAAFSTNHNTPDAMYLFSVAGRF